MRGIGFGLEIEPPVRKRSQLIGQLQVDVVLGRLRGVQLRLGRRTPAVGLRPASRLIMRWPSFSQAWAAGGNAATEARTATGNAEAIDAKNRFESGMGQVYGSRSCLLAGPSAGFAASRGNSNRFSGYCLW